jgi:hypothetical protein
MPITRQELDAALAARDQALQDAERARQALLERNDRITVAETRLADARGRYDMVLNDIISAGNGTVMRDRGYDGMAVSIDRGFDPRDARPSIEEIQHRTIEDLHSQVVILETRLAAALAVAWYARNDRTVPRG